MEKSLKIHIEKINNMNEQNDNKKNKNRDKSVEEGKRHYSLMASQMELAKSLLDPEDFEAYFKVGRRDETKKGYKIK